MRILIDENVPVQLVEMLRRLLPDHQVDHVGQIRWAGKKDLSLLPDAAHRGYQVFLTKDSRQLDDPDETDAIKKSGMHHVRFSQTQRGRAGLGLSMGAVVAAMPLIVEELRLAPGQRLIHIKGLDPAARHRFEQVDPATAPPAYWPR